jgi:hypothetical protein
VYQYQLVFVCARVSCFPTCEPTLDVSVCLLKSCFLVRVLYINVCLSCVSLPVYMRCVPVPAVAMRGACASLTFLVCVHLYYIFSLHWFQIAQCIQTFSVTTCIALKTSKLHYFIENNKLSVDKQYFIGTALHVSDHTIHHQVIRKTFCVSDKL